MDKFNMRVEEKEPKVRAEIKYDERRKHLADIVFSNNNDLTLKEVSKEVGRGSNPEYKYVHHIISGYPGKVSNTVLDEIEQFLRVNDYWEELT